MQEVAEKLAADDGLRCARAPYGPFRRLLRGFIHFFSYHLILRQRWTRTSRAAGFRLTVPPTVFHPRFFITSEFFARLLGTLDLSGLRVAEVGTGSGVIALAAARAGAASVVAVDINPNAARAASENARANGLGDRVRGVCSNLMSALAPRPLFDVILSSPPSFAGEPRDLADRAWHAGPGYRDIAALFGQGELQGLDRATLEAALRELPNSEAEPGASIVQLLVDTGLVSSLSEGRRAIAQGGVSLDNVRIDDENATLDGRVPPGGMAVLRRGKKTLAGVFVR